MALTAIDISQSISLSDNTNLRNTLQKDIGALKTTSHGKSVAQLRAAKRKRRKVNVDEVTAALPLENGHYFRNVQSSGAILQKGNESPIGKNYNSRHFRNKLYETIEDETQDNIVSTISTSSGGNQNSLVSIEASNHSRSNALRNKVMKSLQHFH